jgi:hypothetical protein
MAIDGQTASQDSLAVADGEIAAGQAVFVFNQMPAPAIIASLLFIGWSF